MSCIDAAIIKALVNHVDSNPDSTPSTPSTPVSNPLEDLSPITSVGWSSKIQGESYTNYLTVKYTPTNTTDILVLQTINGYELYNLESADDTTLTFQNFVNENRITFTKNSESGLWETADVNTTIASLPNNTTTGLVYKHDLFKSEGGNTSRLVVKTNAMWQKLVIILDFGGNDYGLFIYHSATLLDGMPSGGPTLRGIYIDLFNPNRYLKLTYTDAGNLVSGYAHCYRKIATAEYEELPINDYYADKQFVGAYHMATSTWSSYQKTNNATNYLLAKITTPIVPTTVFRYIKENSVLEYVCIAADEDEITFIDSSNNQIKFEYIADEDVWRLQVGDHIYVPDSIKTGFFTPESLLWAYIKHLHQLE